MARYVEKPADPREVDAVQFLGIEEGVPLFGESTPSWVVGALAHGTLALKDGRLMHDGVFLEAGEWLLADPGDVKGKDSWILSTPQLAQQYRLKRKKPVYTKPRVRKAVAA